MKTSATKMGLRGVHPQGAHLPAGSGDDPSEGFQDHTSRGSGLDDGGRGVGAQGGDAGSFAWLGFFLVQKTFNLTCFQIYTDFYAF